MISTETISEKWKIIPKDTKIKLNGSMLEIIHETETTQDHHSIDMSKNYLNITSVDPDGFINFDIKPFEKPVFDLARKRMHGNYAIPSNFSEYKRHITSENTTHTVYWNERKQFLLRVETPKGIRIHNLGELYDTKSYLGRFTSLFETWGEWLNRGQIKNLLYQNRMYDAQKMTIALLILSEEGIIKRKDGVYAHRSLELDTGVVPEHARRLELDEQENMSNTLAEDSNEIEEAETVDDLVMPSSLSCS